MAMEQAMPPAHCPGCSLGWWLNPPAQVSGSPGLVRCIECKRVYRITVAEIVPGADAIDAAASVRASNCCRGLAPADECKCAKEEAASMRAEAGTEGMEIIRAVAQLRPDIFLCGITPDHVRQARAIVAAAERKEVMPVEDAAPVRSTVDAAPPTAGPTPEAGAQKSLEQWRSEMKAVFSSYGVSPQPPAPATSLRSDALCDMHYALGLQLGYDLGVTENQEGLDRCIAARSGYLKVLKDTRPPAPAKSGYVRRWSDEKSAYIYVKLNEPPAPAEGGTDVAVLIKELYERWDEDNEAGHGGRTHLCKQAADALAAQAALVQRLSDACVTTIRERDAQAAALAAKEAALHKINDIRNSIIGAQASWKPKGRRQNLVRAAALIIAEIERIDRKAALAGKEPQKP